LSKMLAGLHEYCQHIFQNMHRVVGGGLTERYRTVQTIMARAMARTLTRRVEGMVIEETSRLLSNEAFPVRWGDELERLLWLQLWGIDVRSAVASSYIRLSANRFS